MFQIVRYFRYASKAKNLHLHSTFFTTTTPPPPIEVALTESTGRGVFATRPIGAGELIHKAKPVVSHPTISSLNSVCYYCLKKLHLAKSNIGFCSHECEDQAKAFCKIEKKGDWSAFNDYCRTQGLKYPLLVKRLACMVISRAVSADYLDILQPASLSTHMLSLLEDEFLLLRNTFETSDITNEEISFLTMQWYTGVLARIRINAFRVEVAVGSYEDLLLSAAASVAAEAAVGNAVYMLPSFYNHDCDPNAHILWIENTSARLKALRDIQAGEELTICYIDASMDRDARQTILYEGFGFRCNCLRCSSND
ncbi:histone modifying enzyme [Lithospermum erythrorhizon]|uniref:Histone modifying enzyme n=1 Tax=Lithospermum erythrorhizon TaxID=34254 RepID=A0AAV3P052_LITER